MRRLLALALLVTPALGAAHPLGNFTVNRYAAVHVAADAITIRYVVDMAEIPTFQEMRLVDANGDGTLADEEREAYLGRAARTLAESLVLTVDGTRRPLTAGVQTLEMPPGAGGLPTLRLDITYIAVLPAARGTVELRDENFADRPGWQEMIADASDGLALGDATVPRTDRSQALRAYPIDQLQSPPQVREARFTIQTSAAADRAAVAPAGARAGSMRFSDRLTELVATDAPRSPRLVLASLLVAAALGAFHALTPGHGKTVVGAYLVGARGTAQQPAGGEAGDHQRRHAEERARRDRDQRLELRRQDCGEQRHVEQQAQPPRRLRQAIGKPRPAMADEQPGAQRQELAAEQGRDHFYRVDLDRAVAGDDRQQQPQQQRRQQRRRCRQEHHQADREADIPLG